jgi:hypothetical protein
MRVARTRGSRSGVGSTRPTSYSCIKLCQVVYSQLRASSSRPVHEALAKNGQEEIDAARALEVSVPYNYAFV